MIGLVAGLPLSVPAPTRTARKPDPVEALYRALELRDNQIPAIRKLFDHFARSQSTFAVGDVLIENRAVLRHMSSRPPSTAARRTASLSRKGITAAMAVQDAGGLVQGVLTGDFSLAGIDTFLGRIRIGQRGVVALFDGGGPRFITRSDSRRWPTVADSRSSSCL